MAGLKMLLGLRSPCTGGFHLFLVFIKVDRRTWEMRQKTSECDKHRFQPGGGGKTTNTQLLLNIPEGSVQLSLLLLCVPDPCPGRLTLAEDIEQSVKPTDVLTGPLCYLRLSEDGWTHSTGVKQS